MAGFRLVQLEESTYSSPQEMYSDMKNRKVQSLYDHQSAMIDQYMYEIESKNVSLELPTGSGKTLVGLLIGEYRRRTRKEKVVYCCLNKQLVSQVCALSNSQYGIDARPFLGSKREFNSSDKAQYESASCIAVTTYSALFNSNSYFNDSDFLIFDDAHSAENYVVAPWSIEIRAEQEPGLSEAILKTMRPLMREDEFHRAIRGSSPDSPSAWSGMIPLVIASEQISKLQMIFESYIENKEPNPIRHAWSMLKDNLAGCVMYLSTDTLSIRPIVPPTQQFSPFVHPQQRLYMSGTFSGRGELERTFGLKDIKALPMLEQWKNRTTGRRLFMFPKTSDDDMNAEQIVEKIMERDGRYLVMVSSNYMREKNSKLAESLGRRSFSAIDLEDSKEDFINCENGVVVLASRLDGLDFPNEECRAQIIVQLPMATNMHERFLIEATHANALYSERIRNRVTQALGRCTRNQTDYAVIYVLDENVTRLLSTPRIRRLLNSELQAEIEFGLENATEWEALDDYLKLATLFLDDRDGWNQAENNILALRKQKETESENKDDVSIVLKETASREVVCSLSMWNGQLKEAIAAAQEIVNLMRKQEHLEGYFSYWSYILYHLIYAHNAETNESDQISSTRILDEAKEVSSYNAWIVNRSPGLEHDYEENPTVLARMKKMLMTKMSKYEVGSIIKKLDNLLLRLQEDKGTAFEVAHQELGEWLGYDSRNYSGDADPDPIWIIDAGTCIVAEDKIYESKDKPIPVRHVDEAKRHESWIRSDDRISLNEDAEIVTVFLTNANTIDKKAKQNAGGVWWVEKETFVKWASIAILVLKDYIVRGVNPKDDSEFEEKMSQELFSAGVNSAAFLELIRHKKLLNLKEVR